MNIKQITIAPSKNKNKKLQAIIEYENKNHKTVNFGAKGYSDFTLHKDPDRKTRYLARHKHDPSKIDTAGGLARDILWSEPTLKKAVNYA